MVKAANVRRDVLRTWLGGRTTSRVSFCFFFFLPCVGSSSTSSSAPAASSSSASSASSSPFSQASREQETQRIISRTSVRRTTGKERTALWTMMTSAWSLAKGGVLLRYACLSPAKEAIIYYSRPS